MNNLYQTKESGKPSVSSESILGILLLVAISQIALCFGAGAGLVPPVGQIQANGTSSLETNAVPLPDNHTVCVQASSGFQLAANRG